MPLHLLKCRNRSLAGAALAQMIASPIDSSCPVCRTAEIISGKWTLLIIRDLDGGSRRFCELERSLAGISPRTLSLRLRALEEQGILERRTYPEVPPRVEYALTGKGQALAPLIEDMRVYGRSWLGCEEVASVAPAPAPAHRRASGAPASGASARATTAV